MAESDPLPLKVHEAIRGGVLKRLPLTILPYVNQQLHEWEYLFPNERRSVENLLLFVSALSLEQSESLFRELIEIERKMGVHRWKFSTAEQTIENSSHLARSPYFQPWRQTVQKIFDAADEYALKAIPSAHAVHRLVLIDMPPCLAMDRDKAWRRWQQIGTGVRLKSSVRDPSSDLLQSLLIGDAPEASAIQGSVSNLVSDPSEQDRSAESWIIDAGAGAAEQWTNLRPSGALPVLLSYKRLDAFRQNFSHELNTMRKDLGDADAVYDRLRKVNVESWCPPEIATHPAIREFVRSLYLSGNGAVIFGNSFVEWAASEAFRRARPRLLVARFGVRSRPKPFTSVAVFENPDQINPLPAVDDLTGSAVDASILALYIWLAAVRFEEYRHSTVCVCLAESLAEAYLVAPPEFSMAAGLQSASVEQLRTALKEWMA